MPRRLYVIPAATLALSLGGTLVAAPVAGAQTSASVAVSHACAQSGTGATLAAVGSEKVDVTYPASVAPGQVFTATVWPGQFAANNSEHGRFSYAIALPANVDVLGIRNLGGDYGWDWPDPSGGWALAVERVDTNGNPSATGGVVKISGGATPAFGGDTSTNVLLPQKWKQGLHVSANVNFRFPKVELTLRAPVDRSVNPVAVELFAKGATAANGANNTIQYSSPGWLSLGNQFTFCTSTYTGSLTSTSLSSATPVVATSTTTFQAVAGTVTAGQPVTLRAHVDVSGASAQDMATGTVEFRRTDTGALLGSAKPDPASGDATATVTFPGTIDGYTAPVTATYVGTTRGGVQSIAPSTSGSVAFTVAASTVQYNLAITGVTLGTPAAGSVPTTIAVTAARADGQAFASGLTVQLYRDGQAVGAPKPLAATMSFSDSLPQTTDTVTHYYQVKIAPVVIGDSTHSGTSPQAGAVIVGTNPTATSPHFVDGSVDSSEIFLDREKFLELGAAAFGSLAPLVKSGS